MMDIGHGSSRAIEDAIARMGANIVQIDPSDAMRAGASTGAGGKVTLTPDDCDAIRRECAGVRYAAPSVDCHAQIIYNNRNWSPRNVLGTTPEYLQIREWHDFAEGSSFTEDDVRAAACVCVIGQTVAKNLFGDESPIGQQIRLNNVRLTVRGLLAAKGASVGGTDQDDCLFAPWTTIKYRVSGQRQTSADSLAASGGGSSQVKTLNDLYPSQQLQLYVQPSAAQLADTPHMTRFPDLNDIFVSAETSADVQPVIRQVTQILRERHRLRDSDPDDFRIRNYTEITEAVASTSRLMTNLLLAVALISLVVGGVGIMNIMLVSVTERTKEIGLRMAVGARGADILRQFLLEAVLLCLAGGVTGIGLGRLASFLMTRLLGWPTLFSVTATIAAIAVSATVGILFGFYPAWRASRLDPIEALGHE